MFNQSSVIRNAVGELLGSVGRVPFVPGAQVALRFPGMLCIPGTFTAVPFWRQGIVNTCVHASRTLFLTVVTCVIVRC